MKPFGLKSSLSHLKKTSHFLKVFEINDAAVKQNKTTQRNVETILQWLQNYFDVELMWIFCIKQCTEFRQCSVWIFSVLYVQSFAKERTAQCTCILHYTMEVEQSTECRQCSVWIISYCSVICRVLPKKHPLQNTAASVHAWLYYSVSVEIHFMI